MSFAFSLMPFPNLLEFIMRWIYIAVMMFGFVIYAADVDEQHQDAPKDAGNTAVVMPSDKASPKEQPKSAEPLRQYGDAAVSRFVKVGEGFSFVCCVDGWPDVVGRDITVVIGKIELPGELGEQGRFFYNTQLSKYLRQRLESGRIELCNITRAADKFALVADVKVDGVYLAAELIKQGYAKAIEPPAPPAAPVASTPPQPSTESQTSPDAARQYRDRQGAGNPAAPAQTDAKAAAFVASKNSDLFHKIDCPSAKRITEKNAVYFKTAQEAAAAGKKPCARCKPE